MRRRHRKVSKHSWASCGADGFVGCTVKAVNTLFNMKIDASAFQPDYTPTPDRRYFVVRGRLWRLSNPWLDETVHHRLVDDLMAARRSVRDSKDSMRRISARLEVDVAKRALGERGAVWWTDGAPDYNRFLAVNTPYASWFTGCSTRRSLHEERDKA